MQSTHMKNKNANAACAKHKADRMWGNEASPDVQFDEKVRLFIWRPQGLINESAVNKIITILSDMEASLAEPFNRFSDTSAAEAADLNFKYIFHVSLFRRFSYRGLPIKSAIL